VQRSAFVAIRCSTEPRRAILGLVVEIKRAELPLRVDVVQVVLRVRFEVARDTLGYALAHQPPQPLCVRYQAFVVLLVEFSRRRILALPQNNEEHDGDADDINPEAHKRDPKINPPLAFQAFHAELLV